MTEASMTKPNKNENVHAAATKTDCKNMAKRNDWQLVRIDDNGDRILPYNCVFEGEQTSFQDTWHDNQD
jgi:hypothetical protein